MLITPAYSSIPKTEAVFLRNVGRSLPGYTSLHARGRCWSLLSSVSVGTDKRDGKRMWQKKGNEMKTKGDFGMDFEL